MNEHKKREREMKRHWMRKQLHASSPAQRAEAVARHYLSLVDMATHLKKLCDARRLAIEVRSGDADPLLTNCDEAILHMLNEFASHHEADLGIELAWGGEEEMSPLNAPGRERGAEMSGGIAQHAERAHGEGREPHPPIAGPS